MSSHHVAILDLFAIHVAILNTIFSNVLLSKSVTIHRILRIILSNVQCKKKSVILKIYFRNQILIWLEVAASERSFDGIQEFPPSTNVAVPF